MKLYGITEDDVGAVYAHGSRNTLPDGRVELVWNITDRFRYPLKVVGIETEKEFLVVTAYPLKGVKKGE